jgi:hypothetical protein
MYLVRKGRDDVSDEGGAFHFPGVLVELDVGELRNPVGEEHPEFAIRVGEFGTVDMEIANVVRLNRLRLSEIWPAGRREMPWR